MSFIRELSGNFQDLRRTKGRAFPGVQNEGGVGNISESVREGIFWENCLFERLGTFFSRSLRSHANKMYIRHNNTRATLYRIA